MTSIGPRSSPGLLGLHLGGRVEVGEGRLEERHAGPRDVELLVELAGLLLGHGVGEAVAELVEGQGHRTVPVRRVREHGRPGLERGEREGQHATGRRRVDRAGRRREAPSGEDLHEDAAEGVPDERGLPVEALDDHLLVRGDVTDALPGEHLGMGVGLLDRQRVVGPSGGDGHVARVLEERGPPVPARVQ